MPHCCEGLGWDFDPSFERQELTWDSEEAVVRNGAHRCEFPKEQLLATILARLMKTDGEVVEVGLQHS